MFTRDQPFDPEFDEFRAEVRTFCETELASQTRQKMALGQRLEKEEHDAWLKQLGSKGWLAGKWPTEHGGLGWGPARTVAFKEETARAGAPWLIPFGVTMVGPVIYTFGTDEQKARYLPDIANNNTWWCQGYSEPGSGSDLASLRTRAILDGDHYVVNGQKTWTTLAHWADMMFCLVRTDPDIKAQDGISFLLIDMNTPGITVKPIATIDLTHHLNEVFFDDVRVPVENLVGEPNKGWTYAKYLLAHERISIADVGSYQRYIEQLDYLLSTTYENGQPLREQPTYATRTAQLKVYLATLGALLNDQLASAEAEGEASLIGAATLKIRGSELQQAIMETIVEVLGRYGLAYESDALMAGWNGELVGPAQSAGLMQEHLMRRAVTIYGGTSEIQRSIIAKGALGL